MKSSCQYFSQVMALAQKALILAGVLVGFPSVGYANEEPGAKGPCEFSLIPESTTKDADGTPMTAGRIEAAPGCEYFYFPGLDERELVSNPELWKYTGEQSHFRITSDGKLLFIPSRSAVQQSVPKAPESKLLSGEGKAEQRPLSIQPAFVSPQAGQLDSLLKEREILLARIRELEARLASAQQEVTQEHSALAAETVAQKARLEQFELAMREKEQQLASLQSNSVQQVQALEKKLRESETRRRALGQKLDSVMAQTKRTTTELNSCRDRMETCAAALDRQRQENSRLAPEVAGLEAKLESLLLATRDDDGDGVPNAHDACADTPANLATDASGCVNIDLPGVEFATASAVLNWRSKVLLNHAAALLKELDIKVEVQGHTDNRGSPALNKTLSEKRAEAVAAYLASRGVNRQNLIARGYGDEQPIADNQTVEGRARNRRVTLVRIREH